MACHEQGRRVDLNGIKLKNRFLISAGALEYGRGWPWERPLMRLGFIDPSIFGAVSTRTLTLKPRAGNYIDPFEFEKRGLMSHLCRIFSEERKKVLRKIPGGWINNFGWWNVGIDYYIKEIYPETSHVNRIVSIGGFSTEEYLQLIERLNPLKIAAVELNISCCNVDINLQEDIKKLCEFYHQCVKASIHPLIVKVGVHRNLETIAYFAQWYGVRAIHAINTIHGEWTFRDGAFRGGFSGPRIKKQALRAISFLRSSGIRIPIIGGGGITCWKDCQDFFAAGADAVSFGSVNLSAPWRPTQIVKKHEKELEIYVP